MPGQVITIVSGLPRSGTSMMMQMLEAGGMPVLKDDVRRPDEDNPKGYYEFERVKQIATDQAWLEDAGGKVVKMVSALLPKLPAAYEYRVVFMRRKMEEILASQKVMLTRREQQDKTSDEQMARYFNNHLAQITQWLGQQPNIQVLFIHYNDLLENPGPHIAELDRFLGGTLDTAKMTAVVDRKLYRERKS